MVGTVARHAEGIAAFSAAIKHVDVAIDDLWNTQQNVFIGGELAKVADNLDAGARVIATAAPDQQALLGGIARTSEDLRVFAGASESPRYASIFADGPLTRGGDETARRSMFAFLKTAVDGAQTEARQGIELFEGLA